MVNSGQNVLRRTSTTTSVTSTAMTSGSQTLATVQSLYAHLNPAPCLTLMNPSLRKLKRSLNLPEQHQHQAHLEFHIVFKQCPRLLECLWKIFRVIETRGKAPHQRIYAEGVWLSKEEKASNIEQFRKISLLRVKCKFFFEIVTNSRQRCGWTLPTFTDQCHTSWWNWP